MAESAPFAEEKNNTLPLKKYNVTFLPHNITVEVDPEKIPFGRLGNPGSILDISNLLNNEAEIEHVCGGVCACATCHVKVRSGLESCSEKSEDEQDMLEMSEDTEDVSRLACQCIPDGSRDIAVEILEP